MQNHDLNQDFQAECYVGGCKSFTAFPNLIFHLSFFLHEFCLRYIFLIWYLYVYHWKCNFLMTPSVGQSVFLS